MLSHTRMHHAKTSRPRRLGGLLAVSAAVTASVLVSGPAHADGTPPTVPATASGTGVASTTSWSVVNGSGGMPTATATGLTPMTQLAPDGTATGDPTRSGGGTASPSDPSAPGVHTWTVTVPAGATAIVFTENIFQLERDRPPLLPSITLTGVPDGGGAPVSRAVNDQQTVDTITWANPPAGTYTAEVDTPAGAYDFNASTAVVAPGTVDPLSTALSVATSPDTTSADPTANTMISADWGNLATRTTYYGTISYSDTSDVTVLEVDSGYGYDLMPISPPTMNGQGTVGSTMTVDPGLWPVDVTFTFVWNRDGLPITGATGQSYTLTPADAGHSIRVDVTASARSYQSWKVAPPEISVQLGTAYAATQPTVSGSPRVGKTLTARPGTWSVRGLQFAYQWTANGHPIAGATSPTLKLIPGLAGKAVGVTVTDVTVGYKATTARSATAKVLATPTVRLKLTEKKVRGVRHIVATVTVTASVLVSGKVHLTVGSAHRTLTLHAGRATVNLVHRNAGKVSGKAEYAGSPTIASATAKAGVRLR